MGPSWIPRLTAAEYGYAVLDVLDVAVDASTLPSDGVDGRFVSNDRSQLAEADVDLYASTAETVSDAVANGAYPASAPRHAGEQRLGVLLAAVPTCGTRNAACARAFVAHYGARLYRRPLTTAETDAYAGLYRWATTPPSDDAFDTGGGGTFVDGIRILVEAMLQAPEFLYRVERGVPTEEPGVVALTSSEMASRLAAFLWRSVPDEDLAAAAVADELRTPEQLRAHAARMLDARTGRIWGSFARGWMGTDALEHVVSADSVPTGGTWNATVIRDLQRDVSQFVEHVATDPALGDIYSLLTGTGGVSQGATLDWILGPTGPRGTWVSDIPHRHGLLTLPGVLIANGHSGFVAPHFRGLFVRQVLLCQELGVPSAELADAIAVASDRERMMPSAPTTRARLSGMTESDMVCGHCHGYTNPVGYAFLEFDDFGRHRSTEIGADGMSYALDTSGKIRARPDGSLRSDVDGSYAGATALIDALASSETVARCFARHLTSYATLRQPVHDDEPSVEALLAMPPGPRGTRMLRDMVTAIVATDAFRHRRLPAAP